MYSLPQPPFVPSTTILSGSVNSDFGDIATALTGSVSADGQTPVSGILKGSTTGGPIYSSTLDHTTGFGVSTAGEADIYAGGTKILAVTSTGITVTGTVNYTNLIVNSSPSGTGVTVTSATPGVVTWAAHGFSANQPVWFTAAAMPTGLNSEQIYYVVGASITTNTFEVAATTGGSALNTTSTGTTVLGYTAALQVIGGTSAIDGLTADNLSVNTSLTASGLNFWQPPQGTTVGRPGSPVAGYERYNTTLNVPEWYNGTVWQTPIFTPPIAPAYQGLKIVNNSGTPNTQTNVTANSVVVATSFGGIYYQLNSLSLTLNIASNWAGSGNLDTGSVAPSTWYSVYVIYDPATATAGGLYSLSSTSPTLPTGYTAFARLGSVQTDASSHFYRILQINNRAQYTVTGGTNTANMLEMISGNSGSTSTPTYSAVAVGGFVPTSATQIAVVASQTSTSKLIVAPNAAYGSITSTSNPPPIVINTTASNQTAILMLESTNIYYAADSAGAGASLWALGWIE